MKYLFKNASGAIGVALTSVLTATAVAALSGCAPYVAPANERSASANDERCLVLGSNLPSRKCRTDATIRRQVRWKIAYRVGKSSQRGRNNSRSVWWRCIGALGGYSFLD